MAFSPKQLEVLRFPYTDDDSIICGGSIRSGKSSILSISFVLSSMARFDRQAFAICGRTVQATERNIVKPLMAIKYMRQQFTMNYLSSTHTLTVKRGSKVNIFYIFGGNDESSFTLIQGVTLAGVFLDEVALMPRSFVEQAIARCSVPGSKHFFSCNPEDPSHWFYQEWIQNPGEKKVKYLHFTMDDNPSLTQEIKDRYERMYVGVFYDRYIKGLWVKAEGIIYRMFADNPERYTIDKVPDNLAYIRCGVDFGGNKSAHTFAADGFTEDGSLVILEDEYIKKEINPTELDTAFVAFCNMVYAKYKYAFDTRADNAEPVLMRGIKNAALMAGCQTNVRPALKKPVNQRINTVVRLQGLDKFKIMRHCVNARKAHCEAVWDPKRPDERLDDPNLSFNPVDMLDGIEYGFEEDMTTLTDLSA